MRFVDTNIPVYAVSILPEDHIKQGIAETLLDQDNLAMPPQVLGEFYHQVTRRSRPGALRYDQGVRVIENLERRHARSLTVNTVKTALEHRERFGLSYWDCLIPAAAKHSGCNVACSEDMSPEQECDGIREVNPFKELPQPAIT